MVNDIQKYCFVSILKVKKAFILIPFAKYISKSSQSEKQRKYFLHFSVKSTYHDTLNAMLTETAKRSNMPFQHDVGQKCLTDRLAGTLASAKSESPLLTSTRVGVALFRKFQCQKYWKLFCTIVCNIRISKREN